MKKIYNYHPDTKEYLGESVPRKDPKDLESYLIPAYAAEEPPPLAISGKARLYINGSWKYTEDNRGKPAWKTDGSGEFSVITEFGAIAAGWTLKQFVPFSTWNGSAWVLNRLLVIANKSLEVGVVREAKIAAGITYQFPDGQGTIQTRSLIDVRNIQTNVTTALIFKGAGEIRPVMVFRDQENVLHQMTPDQMLQMAVYIANFGQAIYNRSWELKDAVEGMTTEQIVAFDVEANW
ncbi:MAG: DUF4376 domain-containing protein [Proteobacteria bacterium]|nr:DUF4376 domain-containing protein [Pseudomonadota bacterium]